MRISERKAKVEYIWGESFEQELDGALKNELRQAALGGVKATLEEALNQELNEHLGFGPYQRRKEGPKPPHQQRSGQCASPPLGGLHP